MTHTLMGAPLTALSVHLGQRPEVRNRSQDGSQWFAMLCPSARGGGAQGWVGLELWCVDCGAAHRRGGERGAKHERP